MSYGDGEALILTLIRLHADFDASNTARGNWKLLNSGNSAFYAILRPGVATFTTDSIGGLGGVVRTRSRHWRTEVMVYQRYVDDGTSLTNIEGHVSDLIDHIDQYPQLNDSSNIVRIGEAVGMGELVEFPARAPKWLLWPIFVDWTEEKRQ